MPPACTPQKTKLGLRLAWFGEHRRIGVFVPTSLARPKTRRVNDDHFSSSGSKADPPVALRKEYWSSVATMTPAAFGEWRYVLLSAGASHGRARIILHDVSPEAAEPSAPFEEGVIYSSTHLDRP
jgi:hypothetical protein